MKIVENIATHPGVHVLGEDVGAEIAMTGIESWRKCLEVGGIETAMCLASKED